MPSRICSPMPLKSCRAPTTTNLYFLVRLEYLVGAPSSSDS